MKRTYVGAAVAATVAVLLTQAAPASADTSSYLEGLQPVYTALSQDTLLAAGSMACAILGSGQPAPVAVNALYKEMGISLAAGNSIVTAAVIDLGC
ncbi:DUF732 domain-containing protein [Mycolicibacterium sp. 018/SC-01/001]|uniref:DUF732 domain-containing protein n=1 Tax=Mycolicibacterium sp. 018/SC-01/001 TaxID=2592069 RepID=UPI00163D5B2B|nr:DUF732 domain-containing protein [Mycolicibacterium sp. 018/SC-01/001]